MSTFNDFFTKTAENFESHIDNSIPGFSKMQKDIILALNRVYASNCPMYSLGDFGASNGNFGISLNRSKNWVTYNVDPNEAMEDVFNNKNTNPLNIYINEYFGSGFYRPEKHFDVVTAFMLFQFISPDRTFQIRDMRLSMKDTGVGFLAEKNFPTSEKEQSIVWQFNEQEKDRYKAKNFTFTELQKKKSTVLESMNKNLTTIAETEKVLKDNFSFIKKIWVSGNFNCWIFSNDEHYFYQVVGQYYRVK